MSKKIKIFMVFLIFLGLFGCTEITKPATGSIRVDISGLPAGKTITLGGPGYSKNLTGSSTINGLKPDSYIISAPVFTVNSVKYRSKISKSPIPVKAGQTAFVTVKYDSEQLVKLTVSYEGSGKIISSDGKIDCGLNMNRCSYDFKKGSTVYLIAQAGYQSKFLHWNDEEEQSNRISVKMDEDQSEKAFFSKLSKADISNPVPSAFQLVAKTNGQRAASFSFMNVGKEDLEYNISTEADWLEIKQNKGKVAPEKTQEIEITASCGKEEGEFNTSVVIESNDPDETKKTIPVDLKCQTTPKEYELKIVVSGEGTVISNDGKIDCSAENTEKCSSNYSASSEVVLTAKAQKDNKLSGWSGTVSSDKKELKVIISENISLEAKFVKDLKPAKISEIRPSKLNLESQINSGNGQTISFKNLGDEDLEFTMTDGFDWLTETPTSGIVKPGETAHVAIGVSCGRNAGAFSGTVKIKTNDSDKSLINFNVDLVCSNLPIDKFPLNIYVTGLGKVTTADGKIDCDKDGGKCSFEYESGSTVSLTAEAATDVVFDGWGKDMSGTEPTIEVVLDKAKHVSAAFSSPQDTTKTLTVSVSGQGIVTSSDGKFDCRKGDLNCTVEYEKDAIVTLIPTAKEGESLLSWSGDCSGVANCTLTLSKNSSVTANFSTAHVGNDYEITFELLGSAKDGARRDVFKAAAKRWMRIITDNPGRETVHLAPNKACGFGEGAITADIDGLLIVAAIVPIDGVGGILGQAGPRYIRDNDIPYIGCMQFDEADISNMEANGSFNSVILHEMGHVIGIGTLWNRMNLMNDYKPSSACKSSSQEFTTKPSFIGEQALTEFSKLGGTGNIPVEDEGGPGTRCGHWDEATFKTELMTGWANAGDMPLSRMTAASLADMGYTVNKDAADEYILPKDKDLSSASVDSFELNEVLLMPEFKLNKNGELINLRELK